MWIDKAEVRCRFNRCVESYEENAFAQKTIVAKLINLLKNYCPDISGKVLEVGCGTGLLTAQLQKEFPACELFVNDLVEAMCSKTAHRCQLTPEHCIVGDIEQTDFNDRFQLIVSASTFQWLTRLSETFVRLSRCSCQEGFLVFNTFSEDNYKELKELTGIGLNYYSMSDMRCLLSDRWEILHTEEGVCRLEFETPIEVLRHIKKTGVNGIQLQNTWTPGKLERFSQAYAERFRSGGLYPLTYHPRYFVCRKRKNR